MRPALYVSGDLHGADESVDMPGADAEVNKPVLAQSCSSAVLQATYALFAVRCQRGTEQDRGNVQAGQDPDLCVAHAVLRI